MKVLLDSELILNQNRSVYHLGLKSNQIASNIITVGDPDRVDVIAKYLDKVYFSTQNREFKTIGGAIGNKDLTILSTGIGTDNIDIVLNELAFLNKFDLDKRTEKKNFEPLNIFRLGTSGSVSKAIELDSIVYSEYAISFDDLFKFYNNSFDKINFDGTSYEVIRCSEFLESKFNIYPKSLTLTAKGFYAPQFRDGALKTKYKVSDIRNIKYGENSIGNIEMETAGIYGLSKLLGYESISINAILADRLSGRFSSNPQRVIETMIKQTLEIICS